MQRTCPFQSCKILNFDLALARDFTEAILGISLSPLELN
jgi:hypothetical protein